MKHKMFLFCFLYVTSMFEIQLCHQLIGLHLKIVFLGNRKFMYLNMSYYDKTLCLKRGTAVRNMQCYCK